MSLSAQTYYEATAETQPDRPALAGTVKTDVAIVGAGYAGLNAALELAEAGYRVTLLEAARIGNGGSGRNGGQLLPGMAAGTGTLIAEAGLDGARRLFQLSLDGVALVKSRIERLGIACDFQPGYAAAAVKPRHLEELKRGLDRQRNEFGHDGGVLWSKDEIAQALGTRRYVGGVYDSSGGHLHPLRYAHGLARAAEAAGAVICENSPVIAIEPGDPVRIRTTGGTVEAKHAILSGGALLGTTQPALGRYVLTVPSSIAATAPIPDRRVMSANIAVYDMNAVLDYYRMSPDRRLLFGGRALGPNASPQDIAAEFRGRIAKVFPGLKDIAIDHAWTGLLDMTMSRMPQFGWHAPNIVFAQGFSGHGVNMASLTGTILADAVRGTAERLDLFARVNHRALPASATVRQGLLKFAMIYFRLQDLI